MSKPTNFQQRVIDAVVNEIAHWHHTNDIHSPSHGTSIEHDMFSNLDEWWEDDPSSRSDELSVVSDKVRDLWIAIANLDKCHLREEMNNKLNNNG